MTIDLPTVIQAMPYAANVAQAEMAHPEIQLAITQVMAQQMLEERNKQAAPIEQQDALISVGEDRKERKGKPWPRRRRPPAPQAEETQSGNQTPFAGHIIDMKI
jgi:hypothetical protein